MIVSKEQLKQISPSTKTETIEKYIASLNKAMEDFSINTLNRVACFLAQVIHESAGLERMRENMNYSSKGLLATFPKYFDKDTASAYAHNRVGIASRAYANRMGNGDELSQDGYNYRGGGALHATGKDMYRKLSTVLGIDLVKKPELIETPETAIASAAWIWESEMNLNPLADACDMKRITRKINGGYNGLDARLELFSKAMDILE